MSRSRAAPETSVGLFAFLDVLMSTMGSLILVLMIVTPQIRQESVAKVAAAVKHHTEEPPQPEQPSPVVELPRETVDLNAKLQAEVAELSERAERRRQVAAEDQAVDGAAREKLQQSESDLKELKRRLAQVRAVKEQTAEATAKASAEGVEIESQLALSGARLRKIRGEIAQASTKYTFVAYDGVSGTTRHPILIECTKEHIKFLQDDIELSSADVTGFTPRYNPLLAGAKALMNYWAIHSAPGEPKPYVLLIVRPNGSFAYYLARRLLETMSDSFGYELLAADQKLDIPPAVPEATAACRQAVEKALADREGVFNQAFAVDGGGLSGRMGRGLPGGGTNSLGGSPLGRPGGPASIFDEPGTGSPTSAGRGGGLNPFGEPGQAGSPIGTPGSPTDQSGQPGSLLGSANQPGVGMAQSGSGQPGSDPFGSSPGKSPFASTGESCDDGDPSKGGTKGGASAAGSSNGGGPKQGSVAQGVPYVAVPTDSTPLGPGAPGSTPSGSGLSGFAPTGSPQPGPMPNGSNPSGSGPFGSDPSGSKLAGSEQAVSGQADSARSNSGQSGTSQTVPNSSGQDGLGTGQTKPVVLGTPQFGSSPSGSVQPLFGQSGFGQAGSGQPGSGQFGTSQLGMGQPGTGQPGSGESGAGQSGTAQSGTDQFGMDQSRMGQSGTAPPGGMQPGTAGQPTLGQMGGGQPGGTSDPNSGSTGAAGGGASAGGDSGGGDGGQGGSPSPAGSAGMSGMPSYGGGSDSGDAGGGSILAGAGDSTDSPRRRGGHQWGLSHSGKGVGFEHNVTIVVEARRIIVGEQPPIPCGQAESSRAISNAVVAALDRDTRNWGRPPENFYWVPNIKFVISPGGNLHYDRIRTTILKHGLISSVDYRFDEPQQQPLQSLLRE